MNLQAEKLKLIEWIAQTQDVEFVSRIAEMLKAKQASTYKTDLKPMTVNELVERSRASDADIAAGRVHDIDDVLRDLG
ncbi:MAG: hypothetical protein AB8F78_03510 [Saprospiraceae bacterium]